MCAVRCSSHGSRAKGNFLTLGLACVTRVLWYVVDCARQPRLAPRPVVTLAAPGVAAPDPAFWVRAPGASPGHLLLLVSWYSLEEVSSGLGSCRWLLRLLSLLLHCPHLVGLPLLLAR